MTAKRRQSARRERWLCALHEAGHLCAWRAGNAWDTSCAAHIRGGGGFASPPAGLRDGAYAVGIAAGDYAEKLARRFPVPDVDPIEATCPTVEAGATAEAIRKHAATEATYQCVKRGPDDARILAPFCTKANPTDPADWARMFEHFHRCARDLVRKHAAEIVRVATILFETGEYHHPGDPGHIEYFRMKREGYRNKQPEEMTK